MAYYEDLSPYHYLAHDNAKNIGWLDGGTPFETGAVEDAFLERLWSFLRYPVNVCRGFHTCTICKEPSMNEPWVAYNGIRRSVGYYEIRVWGKDGTIYAAPSLIFHYITQHAYHPPQEFIDAVLESIEPSSEDYLKLLKSLNDPDDFWWSEDRTLLS